MTHDGNIFLWGNKNQSLCRVLHDSNIYMRNRDPKFGLMMTLLTTKKLFPKLYFIENHLYICKKPPDENTYGVGYSLLFPLKVRDYSAVPSNRQSNNLIGNIFMRKRGARRTERNWCTALFIYFPSSSLIHSMPKVREEDTSRA
jgi:hypothetical protein